MTRKILITTVTLAALFLSGCSSKTPEPNIDGVENHNISDATQIADKTVTIDENTYGNDNAQAGQSSINNESNSDVLNASSNINSSANGFKSLYFGFGKYGIDSSMEARMLVNSNTASKNTTKIKIEGNCDEFGTDEYNYALGLKRAKAVKDNMVAQGVSAQHMLIVSFGESNPVCSNPTDGCYAQNRRVDLRLAQ